MVVGKKVRWEEEAEVVIVGYGGAGAITAIVAHDAGAKVLILEKQPCDTSTETKHTPSTRMSGGAFFCPADAQGAIQYLKGMIRIANETMDSEREEMISVFAKYLVEGADWMTRIGIPIGEWDRQSPTIKGQLGPNPKILGNRVFTSDFPELSGSESSALCYAEVRGKYRQGAALFKALSGAVQKRGIPIMWETPARHLIAQRGEVCGVIATRGREEIAIRATRAVVLACGGFEFNEWMKEHYLRVNPVHFYGSPASTGDGILMAMELGASLWHMNSADWRVTMKFPSHPIAFGTQRHETASIFVDQRGNRFTNERFKMHAFGYELTNYDCYAMRYPRVPCYWLFDEKRRMLAPLASYHGACNPPGGIMGDIHYIWSADNQQEIDRGWILKANTIEELGSRIQKDPEDGGLMSSSVLRATVKRYNDLCKKGEDVDFGKAKEWLEPLEDPPYYAVKLWPGGPGTQGGPRRNIKGQVLRVDNMPIPRLYSAGELGSFWGMMYQGGGSIAECIAFGRLAGTNAAAEKVKR